MQVLNLTILVAMIMGFRCSQAIQIKLCGDSTMSDDLYGKQGGANYIGWGQYLGQAFEHLGYRVGVRNYAVGGRSAYTFTNEGRFSQVTSNISKGDIVVIEFGW